MIIDEVVEKHRIKIEFFTGCDLGPKCVGLFIDLVSGLSYDLEPREILCQRNVKKYVEKICGEF